ncbi:MAG: sigma-70 family RNA polymerase sigma factor [Phycisphaerales bacterium]|nr:sigma-70 family RNA polymerase sigma factor [Hyphomonadaceae bacterium]
MQRSPERVLDEYLVLTAQAGSRVALDELARRWTPKLLRHAQHLLGSADQAGDAVQETWLAVARGIRRLEDPARFPGWVFAIATRKCADTIRGSARLRSFREEAKNDPTNEETPRGADDVLDMRRALARLSRDQAVVMAMFYGADLSVEEIAAALAIPAGTVKSRLHNARETLKANWERNDDERSR